MKYIKISGVPEHFNLPWHRLLDTRGAEELGLRCTWRDYPDGTGAMVAALNAGELDVAVLLTEGAVAGVEHGGAFEILSLFTESPLIWGVHVPVDSAWQSVDELAGARFAISRYGSGSHLMSLALAMDRGWAPGDIRFVVVGTLAGAVESFRQHESDVFLWEQFMTQPVVDRGEFRRVGVFVAPWPAFVTCATRRALDGGRADIEALIDAVGREAAALAAAPDAATTIAKCYGLDVDSVAEWLTRTRWATRMSSPGEAIRAAARVLAAAGVIGER